jgi:hypothetical protein
MPTFSTDLLTTNLSWCLLANGLLAFSLNVRCLLFMLCSPPYVAISTVFQLAVLFLISNTSAVVMSISGPLKDIIIVITSVIAFNTPVTLMQVSG